MHVNPRLILAHVLQSGYKASEQYNIFVTDITNEMFQRAKAQ